jgi:hypothetical protein
LAVTASPYANARDQAREAGCRDFIAKPVRAGDLIAALQTHLGLVFEPAQAPAIPAGAFGVDMRGSSALAAVAERLEQAATIGSVSDLQAIARELNSGNAEQVRLGQHIARLTSEFDFEAIEQLASPRQEVHDNPAN